MNEHAEEYEKTRKKYKEIKKEFEEIKPIKLYKRQMYEFYLDSILDSIWPLGAEEKSKKLRQKGRECKVLSDIESKRDEYEKTIKKSNKCKKRIDSLLNESFDLNKEEDQKLNKWRKKLDEIIANCQERIEKEEKLRIDILKGR